jgi:hypothetical protein
MIPADPPRNSLQVVQEYFKIAAQYENNFGNTKYCINQAMREEMAGPVGQVRFDMVAHLHLSSRSYRVI